MTVESTLEIVYPLSRANAAACARNFPLDAPFHFGSVSGKCIPISPRAAAPSRASVIACKRISASEWPSSPNSLGIVTPPRISARPGAIRCESQPRPTRISLKWGGPPGPRRTPPSGPDNWSDSRRGFARHLFAQEQARQLHVGRLGDFVVAVAALDHAHLGLLQAFHQAGFIGAGETVALRLLESAFQQIEAEYLRSLRQHQVLTGQGRADFIALHSLHRIHG